VAFNSASAVVVFILSSYSEVLKPVSDPVMPDSDITTKSFSRKAAFEFLIDQV